jgi:hypothetical protein
MANKKLTVAQRRELLAARACDDAGNEYYCQTGYQWRMLRRLVGCGYLKPVSGGVNVCEITSAGRMALEEDHS